MEGMLVPNRWDTIDNKQVFAVAPSTTRSPSFHYTLHALFQRHSMFANLMLPLYISSLLFGTYSTHI